MKIRTMFWLAVLGGAYYAHRKRGGTMSYDSIMQSLRDLADSVQKLAPKVTGQQPDVSRNMGRSGDYTAPH